MKIHFAFAIALLVSLNVSADPGGKSYKEGKTLYDQGKYTEALTKFQNAVDQNPQAYNGKGNYMIGLCYKKLDDCNTAKSYFKKAYQADPAKGGASSMDKFKEQLAYCKTTIEGLQSVPDALNPSTPPPTTTDPPAVQEQKLDTSQNPAPKKGNGLAGWAIGIVLVLLVLAGTGYWYFQKKKTDKEVAESQKEYTVGKTYEVSEVLFDDLFWGKLSEQFGEAQVQNVRLELQQQYSEVVQSEDEVTLNQLARKIKQIQNSPESVFNA